MPTYGSAIKTGKIPVIGLTPEQASVTPASPALGQLYTDTSVTPKVVRTWDGTAWQPLNLYAGTGAANYAAGNDARLSDQRVPIDGSVTGGTAGTGVKIAAATITDVNVAAANKDGTAGVASLRTLGTGAFQATSGTDARLSDTRTPTTGSVVDASVSAAAAIAESKLALATDAAVGVGSRRTLSLTSATAALPGGSTLNAIAAANVATAAVSLNSQKITNLGAPTAANDAARLVDVQGAAAGIDAQPSVRAATTANVAIATGLVTGTVIDGVTLVTGDRVLVKNQTTASENGSYVVPAAGAAARAIDSISANTFWFVEEGTTNADQQWVVTTNNPITAGTTALVISQFGASQAISGTINRITVTGGVIDIAGTYVGQASITTLGTITTGVWTGTAIAVASGGTGASTATAARTNLGAAQGGYAALLGAVTAGTALVVTHSLGTADVIAQVRDATTNEYIFLDVVNASTTTVTITSAVAYATNALRIVVLPI